MPFWSKQHAQSADRPSFSVEDVIGLARRYVVQETIGPLKRIGKVIGIGLGGAVLTGIGGIVVLLGVLRVLQTETGTFFAGDWTFAPYLLTVLAGVGLFAAVGAVFWSALRVPSTHPDPTGK